MLPFKFTLLSATFQATLVVFILRQIVSTIRNRKTLRLLGPRPESIIFGVTKKIASAPDAGAVFEHWVDEYGPVYQIPGSLGTKRIAVCDPKAIAHIFALDSWKYEHSPIAKWELQSMMGVDGLLCTPGEVHKRQRKILSPVFGPSAIRSYTPIFFDSGYKVKNAWDTIIQSSSSVEAIIDVQEWMNHVSLDSVGIASFSHDFGSLHGHTSTISAIFDELSNFKPSHIAKALMLVAQSFPSLLKLPLPRHRLIASLSESMNIISNNLVEKARVNGDHEKSAIGVLVSAEKNQSKDYMTEAEVLSQMKVLVLAGYETSAASLTWALIDLSMNREKQDKLRAELLHFTGTDPTYEDLTNGLPYLDAVVREVIRLHPPLGETTRVAVEDDIIPLAQPIMTASGASVDQLNIVKGTAVTIPIHCVNRSLSIWGENGKKFVPERWLLPDGVPQRAKEFPGFQHTLTFLEGPRMCLGKGFALTEIKAVLSVLIRNYIFEARDGAETRIELGQRVAVRPRVAGEEGCRVPMRIRRLD